MVVTRVQSRLPGFEEKSLVVIGFETNDLDFFKVNVVTEMVDMAFPFLNECSCWLRSLGNGKKYIENVAANWQRDF